MRSDPAAKSMECELDSLGRVFAVFDSGTQDSGHVSYGVEDDKGNRWFVKTTGEESDSLGGATNAERRQALRKSALVSNSVLHPAVIPVERVIEAHDGVVLVSRWFAGELLHSPRHLRNDPVQPFVRFQRLPGPEIVRALSSVIDLHVALDAAGWTSGDLYDGCLMYDFDQKLIKVMDFEFYQPGPYVNTVGRMPGSTRFMAPEEFRKGATIDARTTVFNLGRMIELLLLAEHSNVAAAQVAARATSDDPAARPASLAELQAEWLAATSS